jgi:alpha-glucosidase (family GH31 glycosyl hydrolase)
MVKLCEDLGIPCNSLVICEFVAWTLSAKGITVKVQSCPYRYQVLDSSNKAVLSSLGKGSQDGYGSIGYADGSIKWGTMGSPGWFSFKPKLEPWHDGWTVINAAVKGITELDLTLRSTDNARYAHVVHKVHESTLRVEVTIDGDKPRAWEVAFSSPSDEAFLGFGERYNRTNQRGLDLYSWPEEGGFGKGEDSVPGPDNPSPNGETMTYYPVPFFISSKGYGFCSIQRGEMNSILPRIAKTHGVSGTSVRISPMKSMSLFPAMAVPGLSISLTSSPKQRAVQ